MAFLKNVTVDIELDRKPMPVAQYKELRYNFPIAAAFKPGETITGNVVIVRKNQETNIVKANVMVSFQGKAEVHIVTDRQAIFIPHGSNTTFRNSGTQFDYQGYTAIDIYFNKDRVVLATDVKLHLGSTKFPFEFTLPHGDLLIAPSFTGRHGDILYGMEARLESVGFEDIVAAIPFIVTGALKLSSITDALEEVVVENEEYVCCACCKQGPLSVTCRLEEGGLLAGDFVEVEIKINNKTSRSTTRIVVEFMQIIKYSAGGEIERKEKKKLAEKTLKGFKRNCCETRKVRLFQVPHVQHTMTSGIINITYQINFNFDVSLSHNLKLELPLIIGTYR